jgi:hypothetical protein
MGGFRFVGFHAPFLSNFERPRVQLCGCMQQFQGWHVRQVRQFQCSLYNQPCTYETYSTEIHIYSHLEDNICFHTQYMTKYYSYRTCTDTKYCCYHPVALFITTINLSRRKTYITQPVLRGLEQFCSLL